MICTKGKNKNMKVLMKDENMWVNIGRSKRAMRITPMQRLLGQASNGDVAKVAFSQDFSGKIKKVTNDLYILELDAKNNGATYQKIILYVKKDNYRPIKAEFYLTSGKHFKTAYYEEENIINGNKMISKTKIVDVSRKSKYTIIENLEYKEDNFPAKYFNMRYLPTLRLP